MKERRDNISLALRPPDLSFHLLLGVAVSPSAVSYCIHFAGGTRTDAQMRPQLKKNALPKGYCETSPVSSAGSQYAIELQAQITLEYENSLICYVRE